jgi:hypothetical protein
MSEFEDNLWQDVLREHGRSLTAASRPAAKQARPAWPRLLAGTSLGLAGIAAVLALVLGAASSSPAFAVTRNHDGTVSVALLRSAGILGANAKLAALGIKAKIVPQTTGCGDAILAARSRSSNTVVRLVRSGGSSAVRVQIAGQRLRLDPRKIPAGKTLLITARSTGHGVYIAAVGVSGVAPACLPRPITAAQRQSFLANAECMRTHGVSNLPNPTFAPDGYGIGFPVREGSLAYEGKAILHASKACENVGMPLPLGGLAGPVSGSGQCCPYAPATSGDSGSQPLKPRPCAYPYQQSAPVGNSGNSGPGSSGNSGSAPPNPPVSQNCVVRQGPPPSGNSGNAGNSGNS